MKKRSVTAKNVTGSLFGGILGILAFGYVHVSVLPIGCLLGVLIGWWYEVIIQSSMDGWHSGMKYSREMHNVLCRRGTELNKRMIDCFVFFKKIIIACVSVVGKLLAAPLAIIRWVSIRPMCKIYFANVLSVIAVILITSLWWIPLNSYLMGVLNSLPPRSDARDLLFLVFIVLFVTCIISLSSPFIDSPENREEFYEAWDYYERLGMVKFFVRGIVRIFIFQVFATMSLVGGIAWFVCVGGIFSIMVLAPIGAVVGAVKGIYCVSKKADHWLCLISTLLVTVISAYLMNPYFGDTRMLWITALATGGVSALITEVVRRAIVHFCDKIVFLRNITQRTIGEQTESSRKVFGGVTGFVGQYCLMPFVQVLRK